MLSTRSRATKVMVAGLVAGVATVAVVAVVAGGRSGGQREQRPDTQTSIRPLEGLAQAMEANRAIEADPCAAADAAALEALGLRGAVAVPSVDFVARRCRWELAGRVLEVRIGTDTSIHHETFADRSRPRVEVAGARRAVVVTDAGSESVVALAGRFWVEVASADASPADGTREVLVSTAAAVAVLGTG